MKSILDRAFRYRNSASHEDGGQSFRRRMEARRRLAQRRARQEATAPPGSAKVQPITPRRQKV